MLTLGSLFDGIGGWCLAAQHNGVKPVWSSEIEKFPMAVTKHHFPDVIQLGDITKLDGATLPPVDIICAGSPCQDLSLAGKREGLKGERSGLFRTAIDIVYGMRRATGGKYPRWFVWENVPGAFSSGHDEAGNKVRGADFRAVLSEVGQTEIPMPADGRWADAGMVQCPDCEIAWRVLDAQFFGVPQRRRRIFLVADFRTCQRRAKEVLLVEPRMSGNLESCRQKGQTVASGTEAGAGDASECYAIDHVVTTGGNCTAQGPLYYKEKSPTLKAGGTHAVSEPIALRMRAGKQGGGKGALLSPNKSLTLAANTNDQVVFSLESMNSEGMKSANPNNGCVLTDTARTIDTTNQDPSGYQGGMCIMAGKSAYGQGYVVRRLTPIECERLQGLPDNYTLLEGEKICSDSARYKALGNGMAQPVADFVIRRIVEEVEGCED